MLLLYRNLPGYQRKQNFWLCANIFNSWWSGTNLSSKYIVENLSHIFFTLEIYTIQILQNKHKHRSEIDSTNSSNDRTIITWISSSNKLLLYNSCDSCATT